MQPSIPSPPRTPSPSRVQSVASLLEGDDFSPNSATSIATTALQNPPYTRQLTEKSKLEVTPRQTVRHLRYKAEGTSKIVFECTSIQRDGITQTTEAVKELKDPNNQAEFQNDLSLKNLIQQRLSNDEFEKALEVLDLPKEMTNGPDGQPRLISECHDYTLTRLPLAPENVLPQILSTFTDISEGLHYLHKADLVHGDIKPDNILAPKNNLRGKITDFGGLKDLLSEKKYPLTVTAEYLSPEFFDKTTKATDVYAMGFALIRTIERQVFPTLLQSADSSKKTVKIANKCLHEHMKYRIPIDAKKAEEYKKSGFYVRRCRTTKNADGTVSKEYHWFPKRKMRSQLFDAFVEALTPTLTRHEYDALSSLHQLAIQCIYDEKLRPTALEFNQRVVEIRNRTFSNPAIAIPGNVTPGEDSAATSSAKRSRDPGENKTSKKARRQLSFQGI
ncbi:MAG: protein kinase [Chlamydiales bacterium]|nr:protein kinase [Chlamydiales bacterium]